LSRKDGATMGQISLGMVLRLAAAAEVDPRTARKALARGAEAVRGRAGERVAEAAKKLGLTLGVDRDPE
jgi:hypothetical protein